MHVPDEGNVEGLHQMVTIVAGRSAASVAMAAEFISAATPRRILVIQVSLGEIIQLIQTSKGK
jgi:hypothetical protein